MGHDLSDYAYDADKKESNENRQGGTYAVPRNATERAQTALARQQEAKRLRKAASERRRNIHRDIVDQTGWEE